MLVLTYEISSYPLTRSGDRVLLAGTLINIVFCICVLHINFTENSSRFP